MERHPNLMYAHIFMSGGSWICEMKQQKTQTLTPVVNLCRSYSQRSTGTSLKEVLCSEIIEESCNKKGETYLENWVLVWEFGRAQQHYVLSCDNLEFSAERCLKFWEWCESISHSRYSSEIETSPQACQVCRSQAYVPCRDSKQGVYLQ